MATEDKHARTEPPTPKRKKEARDRGQVSRSPDVAAWMAVLVGSYLLTWVFNNTEHRVLGVFAQAANVMSRPTAGGAFAVLTSGLRVVVVVIVPMGAIFAGLAVVTNVAQTGRSVSLKAARPRFERINPKNGIKRLFGPQTLEQLGKQSLKLTVLALAGYQVIHRLVHEVTGARPVGIGPILGVAASTILGFVRLIALLSVIIGLGDYAFQKRRLKQSLKMTKNEVKEEAKAAEGDPVMKGELKRRQYAIARSRAVRAVHSADVVVTNPTHYAVALQYQPGSGSAPRVVAKGADMLAARIRAKAVEADVPIVEDPPLARYLYAVCEIDQQIPGEIYVAVARLLAFVYSLPAMSRTGLLHQSVPSQLPDALLALEALPPGRRQQAEALLSGARS